MKKILTLLTFLSLIVATNGCSKKNNELNPDKGSLLLTIEGVTYNFEVDYSANSQQNISAVFSTNASDNTSAIIATNNIEGTAFMLRLDNKVIQMPGEFAVSPDTETGVASFSNKTDSYRQTYQEGCDTKLLYTNVTLGVSGMSKNNLIVQGSIKGKMVRSDGELDCALLKTTKWKQVDITGSYKLRWQIVP